MIKKMQIKRGRYLQNIYFSPNYESEVKEIEIIGILIIIKKEKQSNEYRE